MQGTALLQDGALACTWTREGKQRPAVVIIALDEGANGFGRSEQPFIEASQIPYQSLDIADGAYTFCQDDGQILCHWNVLAGDVWLSFMFGIVDESDNNGLADGAIGAIINNAIDALATAPRNEIDRAEPTLPGCHETLTQQGVADALGVPATSLNASAGRPLEYALGSSTPEFGQVMWAYSYERLGWGECTIQGETVSFTSIVAPGAAWILDEPGAVQPEVIEVADLGRGIDECSTEGDFTLCTVAVAVGEDVALVQLSPDDPARGSELALAIVRLLVG